MCCGGDDVGVTERSGEVSEAKKGQGRLGDIKEGQEGSNEFICSHRKPRRSRRVEFREDQVSSGEVTEGRGDHERSKEFREGQKRSGEVEEGYGEIERSQQ